MVFCYKIITDSPAPPLSCNVSPRKSSPTRLPKLNSSISQLVGSVDLNQWKSEDLLAAVPEHDIRLLTALAKRRNEDLERERLADQFRRMWQREKNERQMMEAEITHQYKRYIHKRREEERQNQDYWRLQRAIDEQIRKGQLQDCIKYKERRSEDILAWNTDKKASDLIDKAIEDEARACLAASRRSMQSQAEQVRRIAELEYGLMKADDARRRRDALIKDATQRLSINNALSLWESSLIKQEVDALETARRANHAARAAMTNERSIRLAKARDMRIRRAKQLAAFTALLREAVRQRSV